MLLNMSVPSTRHLVDDAVVLVRQLPDVWRALADHRIDETRAKVIVRALRYQAASHGGPAADHTVTAVAALGIGWAARGCPPTTLRERLDAALIAADPAAADRRAQLRTREGDVRVTGTGDGLADLTATRMDTADATLARAQLDAYARRIKADGDPRPIGAIRVAVLASLIARPWEKRDPAVAHVTIDADLADLAHLPDLGDLIAVPDDDPTTSEQCEAADPSEEERARVGVRRPPEHSAPGPRLTGCTPPAAAPASADPPLPRSTGAAESARVAGRSPAPDVATRLGGQVGLVGGRPVSPAAVRVLLERIDALGLVHPVGGHLTFTLTGDRGRLLAVATPDELAAAAKAGTGIGPPPPTTGYTPTAAQYRYLRARDRHCRFPGCRQVVLACDADHVIPYDHRRPADGGRTCVTNLVMLCRHHHRLKTHALGWRFRLEADGTLHVTTPGGTTRTTRPPAADQVLDLMAGPPPPGDLADDPPPF